VDHHLNAVGGAIGSGKPNCIVAIPVQYPDVLLPIKLDKPSQRTAPTLMMKGTYHFTPIAQNKTAKSGLLQRKICLSTEN
jgi:hypothetical protein